MTQAFAEVLQGSRWLVEPSAMRALVMRALALSSQEVEAARIAVAAMGDRELMPTMVGDVAVIPMTGFITYKASWFSMLFGCSIQQMQAQFRVAVADASTRTILFRCDSPGGVVDMVPEFADEIYAARGTKPMLAVADPLIASAAYWLTSQCDTIYASRSSMLGSIGTKTEHEDISALLEKQGVKMTIIAHPDAKRAGNPYEPLSEEARAELQAWVDEVGLEFEAAVSRGRGVPKARVVEWTQLCLTPRGKRALSLGLADKVGTFDGVLGKLTKTRQATTMTARAADQPDLLAVQSADDPLVAPLELQGDPDPESVGQSSEAGTGDLTAADPEIGHQEQADTDALAVAMVLGG